MKKLEKQRQEFVARLTLMMHEAGQLELWRTMHKLHDAVREVGWELAGEPTPSRPEAPNV